MKTETQIAEKDIGIFWVLRNTKQRTHKNRLIMQTHKASCQRFLEFLEKNYNNFTWDGLQKAIQPLLKKQDDLKNAIKKYEENGI